MQNEPKNDEQIKQEARKARHDGCIGFLKKAAIEAVHFENLTLEIGVHTEQGEGLHPNKKMPGYRRRLIAVYHVGDSEKPGSFDDEIQAQIEADALNQPQSEASAISQAMNPRNVFRAVQAPRCGTCPYWTRAEDGSVFGSCRGLQVEGTIGGEPWVEPILPGEELSNEFAQTPDYFGCIAHPAANPKTTN